MRQALRFGLLWFLGLFLFDAVSSYHELGKAFTRMEADPDAIETATARLSSTTGEPVSSTSAS